MKHIRRDYERSFGQAPARYTLPTNFGPAYFDCWELVSSSDSSGGENLPAQGALIVVDVNGTFSLENALRQYHAIVRVYGDIPIALCGNTVAGDSDSDRPPLGNEQIRLDQRAALPYFAVSTRMYDNVDLHRPFLWLTRQFARIYAWGVDPVEDIYHFVGDPVPDVNLTAEQIAQIEADYARAYNDDDL